MRNIQTSELEGVALDWAVATCEGLPIKLDPMGFITGSEAGYWIWDEAPKGMMAKIGVGYSPSKSWGQGGPLIEREQINLSYPDPLTGAMRRFVAKKMGDVIQIPDSLVVWK